MWTDSHAHLDKLTSYEEALKKAKENSVHRVITIGTEYEDWPKVISLTEKAQVYGTLGLHPHEAEKYDENCESFLKKHLSHKQIVAVGEIGLDYYYEHSSKDVQKDVFHRQLSLAEDFKLPVEIHSRNAEEDTLSLLKEFRGRVKGLLHCFTSSYEMASKALDYGFNISFSGVLTFKNAEDLRKTCSKMPLNRIHIETDCPYLAPVPHRGKENQPAWVVHVAETVCDIHKVDKDFLSSQLEENTLEVFSKIEKGKECQS